MGTSVGFDAVSPDVRLAGPDDVGAMGVALARAFADDPVFAYLTDWMDDAARARRLVGFFAASARTRLPMAGVWTEAARIGAALWVPPGQHLSQLRELPEGIAFVRAAWRSAVKGIRVQERMRKAHPRDPEHWYLAVLGTDPDHQGKGVGSALLAPVLERCDAEGVPAYLESSKESNIPFYERHGWKVTGEIPLGKPGSGAPSLWPMWRDPR
jgi:GNAT superfamily N-acetyltransferase